MNDEQTGGEDQAPALPPGAAPNDHPGWRLAFLLVELGCGTNNSGWSPYTRITVWAVAALLLLGFIAWLAGPWAALGGGGAFGAVKAGKAVRRRFSKKNKEITESESDS